MSRQPYLSLTERGRGRRLRALALKALEQYDLEVARLRLITNSFNGIFRVDTRQGEKWILRVTTPEGGHSRDHVAAEMDWLKALARETDLSVPRPLAARDGALVVEAAVEEVPEPRWCEVFSWVPGTDLARHVTPARLELLGELSARLHTHARTYRPPEGLNVLTFDRVFPFPEPVILFETRFEAFYPPGRRELFRQAEAWASAALSRLLASGEPPRIIHGDLHVWNVRCARNRLSPIDFEDLMWGWPIQDIAITLYYLVHEAGYAGLRAAFQLGYERAAPWPAARYPDDIEAFMAARGLGLLNLVLQEKSVYGPEAAGLAERLEARLRRWMAAGT